MNKFVTLLTTLALALFLCVPASAESVLLNGQKHYYTVQLRSDKRAIVYARIIFENPSADKDLATYEFSLPSGVTIQSAAAQQVLAKSTGSQACKTYETLEQWRVRVNKAHTYSDSSYDSSKQCQEWQPAEAYDETYNYDQYLSSSTDYYYYSYYQNHDTKFDYIDLTQKNTGSDYTVTLSQPIKPKKQGSILVSFTTSNFVTSGMFGKYDYNVRTLLTKQIINKATVSVNFDDDMFTPKATQKRTYETDIIKDGANTTSGSSAYQSKSMDSLLGSIGSGGIFVKSQSSLLPGDTLSVTGMFGASPFALYSDEIIITLLALALFGIAMRIYILWRRAHPHKQKSSIPHALNNSHTTIKTLTDSVNQATWGRIATTNLASVFGTIVVCLALSGVTSTSYGSGAIGLLTGFGVAITLLFGAFVLPMLYIFQYGTKSALRWALVQFALIIVLLLIVAGITTGGNPSYYN